MNQDALERFDATEGWRQGDIPRLRDQLDHHWAQIVTDCARADDPLAYGIDKLRHARFTLQADRTTLDVGIPDDRDSDWQQARRQLPRALRDRHRAETDLADRQAAFHDAGRRRWGRQDHQAITSARAQLAIAELRFREAAGSENGLRDRLAALSEHQRGRSAAIATTARERQRLDAELAQIDAALDFTRPGRVTALADDPPDHLTRRFGPAPTTPAGRAVWCHHALDIEAFADRNDGRSPTWTGWSQQTDRARHEVNLADRALHPSSDRPEPTEWAQLARHASLVLEQARQAQRKRATQQPTRGRSPAPYPTPWIDPAGEQPRPGISP